MAQDFPPLSFPKRVYPHDGRREVFCNYGMYGHMYQHSSGEIVKQLRADDLAVKGYAAMHPVLPLAKSPEKVEYPFQDRVMGKTLLLNKKIREFINSIKCMWPRYTRVDSKAFEYTSKTHLEIKDCLADSLRNPEYILDEMGGWTRQHLQRYLDVKDAKTLLFNNSSYTGGCLGHFPSDTGWGYLVSPSGQDFDTLTVRAVSEESEGLLHSETVAELEVEDPVYELGCATVQGKDYVITRTETEAQVYRFRPDRAPDDMLEELTELTPPSGKKVRSVTLSPYIPGECLVTTEGECYMWQKEEELVPVYSRAPAQTSSGDQWCAGYYGSQPRQLLYADLLGIQMVDLRARQCEAVELMSLPSPDFHQNELIRACRPLHSASPFQHLVGSDYSLLLMDERFPKHPVLHLDHMLTCPPQYFDVLARADSSDIVAYLGSQSPANVHSFRVSLSADKPAQSIGHPWRAAQMTDLCKWPQFLENCTNPLLLKQRVSTSLAGLQVVNCGSSHAVFQMNSYGEVWHQVFRETVGEEEGSTFAWGMGTRDLRPSPSALERARYWIHDMEKNMRQEDNDMSLRKTNMFGVFDHMHETAGCPDPQCALCIQIQHSEVATHDHTEEEEDNPKCRSCLLSAEQGRELLDSTLNKTLLPADEDMGRSDLWSHLPSPDTMPGSSTLTKILCKRWDHDDQIKDLLKERKREIKEKIKKFIEFLAESGGETSGAEADTSVANLAEDTDKPGAAAKPTQKTSAAKRETKKKRKMTAGSDNLGEKETVIQKKKGKKKSKDVSDGSTEKTAANNETTKHTKKSASAKASGKKKSKSMDKKRKRSIDSLCSQDLSDSDFPQHSDPVNSPEPTELESSQFTQMLSPISQSEDLTNTQHTDSIFKKPFTSPLSKNRPVSTGKRSSDSNESTYVAPVESDRQRTDSVGSLTSTDLTLSTSTLAAGHKTLDSSFDSGSDGETPRKKRKTQGCSETTTKSGKAISWLFGPPPNASIAASAAPGGFSFGVPATQTTTTVTAWDPRLAFGTRCSNVSSTDIAAAAFGSTTTTSSSMPRFSFGPSQGSMSTPFATLTATPQACFSFRAALASTAAGEFSFGARPETTTSSAPAHFSFGAGSESPFGTTTQTVTTTAAAFSFAKTATTQNTGEPGRCINPQIPQPLGIEGPNSNSVFIVNLDYKVNLKKLVDVFRLAGNVVRANIKKDKFGRSQGKASVSYETPMEAELAVSMFHNQSLNDRIMKLRLEGQRPVRLPSGLKSVGPSLHTLSQVGANVNNKRLKIDGQPPVRLPSGLKSVGPTLHTLSQIRGRDFAQR